VRGGRWVIVGLVLFIAADVVLVAMTFRHVAAPPPVDTSASRTPSAVRTPSSSPAGSTSPASPDVSRAGTPAAEPTGPGLTAAAPVAFLSVGRDGAVLRTSRGECPGSDGPDVVVAPGTDQDPVARRVPGLRTVVAAQAVSRRNLVIVGLNRRCRPGVYASKDGGRTWTRSAGDAGQWHLSADATALSVVSPAGQRHIPCVPLSLSQIDASTARVLCDDGGVLGTQDSGTTWITLGVLSGAVDIRYTTPGAGVALATLPRCRAAVMQTADGGATWQRLACLAGRRPRAIAARSGRMAAQVGQHLYVSTDSGSRWRDLHWDE
jgi:photosystem II stability/assembly factor-like uncharacterized protein